MDEEIARAIHRDENGINVDEEIARSMHREALQAEHEDPGVENPQVRRDEEIAHSLHREDLQAERDDTQAAREAIQWEREALQQQNTGRSLQPEVEDDGQHHPGSGVSMPDPAPAPTEETTVNTYAPIRSGDSGRQGRRARQDSAPDRNREGLQVIHESIPEADASLETASAPGSGTSAGGSA